MKVLLIKDASDRRECIGFTVATYIYYTLTGHFDGNTCSPARSCDYPNSQSCDSSIMHTLMQMQAKRFS